VEDKDEEIGRLRAEELRNETLRVVGKGTSEFSGSKGTFSFQFS